MSTFQQAPIAVQKVAEFQQLKSALQRIFAPGVVERFLGKVQGKGIPVREFERILERGIFEACDPELGAGASAKALYEALTVSDQGQMREFYLTEVEHVADPVREKYSKVFRYS